MVTCAKAGIFKPKIYIVYAFSNYTKPTTFKQAIVTQLEMSCNLSIMILSIILDGLLLISPLVPMLLIINGCTKTSKCSWHVSTL